jgi:hypothetical protein
VHHFFPRALLRKRKEIEGEEINTFANYTIISAATNLHVSSEEPGSYLERFGIPKAELRKQCIPLDRALWRAGRYRDFLKQRRALLVDAANNFLGV